MKKLLILFLFLIFCLSLFANFSYAGEHNSQYVKEINKVINAQIPIAKKRIKVIEKEFKAEQNTDKKTALIEQGIDDVLYDFFTELINTTDKYMNIKSAMPTADSYGDLQILVRPYLESNNINIKKVDKLDDYAHKKYCNLKLSMIDMSDIPPKVIKYAHKHGYDIVKLDEWVSDEQVKIYQLYSKYDWSPVEGGHLLIFNLVYLIADENGLRLATKDEAIKFEMSKW